MTDKTDIAALMRDMRDLADRIVECQGENTNGEEIIHLYDQSDTTFKAQNILLVLNAFEAERQRADNANDGWGNVIAERDAAEQKSRNYEQVARGLAAEIAALKGEQVPVAVVEPNDNLTVAEIRGDIPRRKAVRELYEGALVLGQELFAAPQNPVVLLGKGFKRDIIAGMSAPETEWFSRKDVTAAIEAAGGIVKDGE